MAMQPRTPQQPPVPGTFTPGAGIDHAPGAPMDAAAFDRFYDDNVEHVYGFVARRFEDRAIAEELTAVAFERAASVARSGSVGADELAGFTLRVAASAVVDHVRRTRRSIPSGVRASDFDEGEDQAEAEALSDEAATRVFAMGIDGDRLRRAVLDLPEDHRRAILVAYFDGLAPSEVAGALGCSVAEVPLRVHRALRALRAAMSEDSIGAA
jgi:RNA polymerase sigma-70 factor (ECF subfamily)